MYQVYMVLIVYFTPWDYIEDRSDAMEDDVQQKIDQFFSQYPQRSYPEDQIIIFAEENPDKVFHIVSGKVAQYDISYRGDEVIINLFKSPAFFPMANAINHIDNHFFFKTETETVVQVAPPKDVVQFLRDNPDVMLDLLSRVYKGLDGVLGRMVHLMSGTARSRLIYELIIECRRFGHPEKGTGYILDTHETHLAARSGLSRETVSREMKRLKEQSIIAINPSGIHVVDLPRLESLLGLEI